MQEKAIIEKSLALIEKSKIAMVGTNGPDGFPYIKAMLNLRHEGLTKFWFSTNTSTKRIRQLQSDNRACLYFADEDSFEGLMLKGSFEILQDEKSRQMMWSDGCEVYYPLGVNDPDYTVLLFKAEKGNLYQGLKNFDFDV